MTTGCRSRDRVEAEIARRETLGFRSSPETVAAELVDVGFTIVEGINILRALFDREDVSLSYAGHLMHQEYASREAAAWISKQWPDGAPTGLSARDVVKVLIESGIKHPVNAIVLTKLFRTMDFHDAMMLIIRMERRR